ncbi:uncharacterized protein VSU04_015495 [Chlamydotis macqueenii]
MICSPTELSSLQILWFSCLRARGVPAPGSAALGIARAPGPRCPPRAARKRLRAPRAASRPPGSGAARAAAGPRNPELAAFEEPGALPPRAVVLRPQRERRPRRLGETPRCRGASPLQRGAPCRGAAPLPRQHPHLQGLARWGGEEPVRGPGQVVLERRGQRQARLLDRGGCGSVPGLRHRAGVSQNPSAAPSQVKRAAATARTSLPAFAFSASLRRWLAPRRHAGDARHSAASPRRGYPSPRDPSAPARGVGRIWREESPAFAREPASPPARRPLCHPAALASSSLALRGPAGFPPSAGNFNSATFTSPRALERETWEELAERPARASPCLAARSPRGDPDGWFWSVPRPSNSPRLGLGFPRALRIPVGRCPGRRAGAHARFCSERGSEGRAQRPVPHGGGLPLFSPSPCRRFSIKKNELSAPLPERCSGTPGPTPWGCSPDAAQLPLPQFPLGSAFDVGDPPNPSTPRLSPGDPV